MTHPTTNKVRVGLGPQLFYPMKQKVRMDETSEEDTKRLPRRDRIQQKIQEGIMDTFLINVSLDPKEWT